MGRVRDNLKRPGYQWVQPPRTEADYEANRLPPRGYWKKNVETPVKPNSQHG